MGNEYKFTIPKEEADQYNSIKIELIKIEEDIEKIENSIKKLHTEKVVDKVYGGFGGKQGFRIEGVPVAEIARMERLLISKKTRLVKRKNRLLELENKIEAFIDNIPVSQDRLILKETWIKNKKQREIADELHIDRSSVSRTLKRYTA